MHFKARYAVSASASINPLQEASYSWADNRGKLQLFLRAPKNEVICNMFNCFFDCEYIINLTKISLLDLNKVDDVVHEIL